MRWMVEVHQSGGMVKHIGMGELNALPLFFCAVSAKGRDKIVKTEKLWSVRGRRRRAYLA